MLSSDSIVHELEKFINRSLLERLLYENMLQNSIVRRDVIQATFPALVEIVPRLTSKAEISAFAKILNIIFPVIERTIAENEWDLTLSGLQLLEECTSEDSPSISNFIKQIISLIRTIFQNRNCENAVALTAANIFMNLIEKKPKVLVKEKAVTPMLQLLFNRIGQENIVIAGGLLNVTDIEARPLTEEEEQRKELQRHFQMVIDNIAIHIPSKNVVGTLNDLIHHGLKSTDPCMLKSSCIFAGTCVEGCTEFFFEILDDILPLVLHCLEHLDLPVKECASYCLGQFAIYLKPVILRKKDLIIPKFLAVMNESEILQYTTCYFMENYLEYLDVLSIKPYLRPLHEKIAVLLTSTSVFIQEMGLIALSSLIMGVELEILFFANTIGDMLKPFLFLQEERRFKIRGRALDALSHLMFFLGKEHFNEENYTLGMQSAMENLTLFGDALKEHSFVFLANVAKVRGKSFGSVMPEIVEAVSQVLHRSDEFIFTGAEDDDEEDEEVQWNQSAPFISAKRAALTLVASMSENTEGAFYPYLSKIAHEIWQMDGATLMSYLPEIRSETVATLYGLVCCLLDHHGVTTPVKNQILYLPMEVVEFLQRMITKCLDLLSSEEDKNVVSKTLDSLHEILDRVGLALLDLIDLESKAPFLKLFYDRILLYLNKLAPCQQKENDEDNSAGEDIEEGDEEEEEENEENNDPIFDDLTELISSLVKVKGASFKDYFDNIHPILLKYAKPPHAKKIRSTAIACYCDVFECFDAVSSRKYAEAVLPIIRENLGDTFPPIRRNSAYCLAMICENSDGFYISRFPEFLQWLQKVLISNKNEEDDDANDEGTYSADVDNALATVARMIKLASHAIPLGIVLPTLLETLPLKEDFAEGPTIYGVLLELVQNNEANTIALLPRFVEAFGDTFQVDSGATDKTLEICATALQHIRSVPQHSQVVESYLSSMDETDRDKLFQKLKSLP